MLMIKDLIDTSQGFHKFGCVRIHAETKEHFLAKCSKAWDIHKLGHKVGSEIKLQKGGIADLMDMTTGEIFEYEKNKKIDKKRGERSQL
jgi:hypothetical protein